MEKEKKLVKLRGVSKRYVDGEIELYALAEVDLDIVAGEFVSLCGPSGSGKTTLLNMIGGLDTPTSGTVIVDDMRIDEMSSSQRARFRLHHLGFVFQSYNLIPVLTARENVEFVMQLQGIDSKERERLAMEILNDVGLEGLENRRPGELSGGQQQRVAVARAIVTSPKIVLADEPTANLDSNTAKNLLLIMRRMNEERGVTFIFSTHDKLVMDFAKRIIELKDGKIEKDEKRG